MAYYVHYTIKRLYQDSEQPVEIVENGNCILRRKHPIKWQAEAIEGTQIIINFYTTIPDAAIKHAGINCAVY